MSTDAFPRAPRAALRTALAATAGLALSILAACSFNPPSPDGTQYRCSSMTSCPSGYTCVGAVCRDDGGDAPDAEPGAPDARPTPDAEPGAPDARPAPDAAPGSPDARVAVTRTFGERNACDVRGVTTDTFLQSDFPTTANGNALQLIVDASPAPAVTLMRFDVSAIPRGSIVEAAELEVVIPDPFRPYAGEIAIAEALTVAWSEASATWNQASSGAGWPSPGAGGAAIGATVADDFAPQVDMAYVIPLTTSVVQAWVDSPSTNFGLRWKSTGGGNNLQFHSSEGSDGDRPMLRVRFR